MKNKLGRTLRNFSYNILGEGHHRCRESGGSKKNESDEGFGQHNER
jgi:hypothetical protein